MVIAYMAAFGHSRSSRRGQTNRTTEDIVCGRLLSRCRREVIPTGNNDLEYVLPLEVAWEDVGPWEIDMITRGFDSHVRIREVHSVITSGIHHKAILSIHEAYTG